jgi:hypothetical protein
MKKFSVITMVIYTLFVISGSHIFANDFFQNEETVLLLGGRAGWEMTAEYQGVGVYDNIRPYQVMALSSSRAADDAALDLAISFDAASSGAPSPAQFRDINGNYRLEVGPSLSFVGRDMARLGTGAARFFGASSVSGASSIRNESPLLIIPADEHALMYSGQNVKDFSMSFWLYPMNAENGEQILSWIATRQNAAGESVFQRIQCNIVKNKLQWDFIDFFFSPDDRERLALSVSSSSSIIPRTWSHHLIRFDSDTGRMEYLVNGEIEGIVYASSSGREGGDVYLPKSGNGGQMALGNRYTGLLDEFRVYASYLEHADTAKFVNRGGSFLTKPINMGTTNSWVKQIDVSGGITSAELGSLQNTYLGNRVSQLSHNEAELLSNNEALQFFIRTADNPYRWENDDSGWVSFYPGEELPNEIRGKWMQIMVNLYPGGDAESSPYIDEMKITYLADSAPPPPSMVHAIARDGAVDLSWRPSSDADLGGYLVYYGTSKAEYFGESAILGVSPINVGISTSVHIDGLENGTLYYFAVAAYDKADEPHIGDFSREIAARPLRVIYPASW